VLVFTNQQRAGVREELGAIHVDVIDASRSHGPDAYPPDAIVVADITLQPEQRTVQGEVERILSKLTNRLTAIVGSGRTDSGVHATGQVAAAAVPERWTPHALRKAMNALLPHGVWVADAILAAPYVHPRYDATARSYVYRIGLAQVADSPFHAPWCWPLLRPVDLAIWSARRG
jgi:tRNA U38,U39,U40 pseudouridine synthase TruA